MGHYNKNTIASSSQVALVVRNPNIGDIRDVGSIPVQCSIVTSMGMESRRECIYVYVWASQVALVVKNPPATAGDVIDVGSIPGSGRCPGGGHGNPFQNSCLGNPMDRRAWQATVHRVTKSPTQLKRLSTDARNVDA